MNIISMGDAKFFSTVLFSIFQAAKHYPDSTFILYDWGFEPEQKKKLLQFPSVTLINWTDRLVEANRVFRRDKGIKHFLKAKVLRHPDVRRPLNEWQREFLLDEKCYCILDACIRGEDSFLFLDADAFLVNRIDELISTRNDVMITLRPLHEIEEARKRGSRHDINSGVIFFNKDKIKTLTFIIEWIKEMNILNLQRHPLSEQTALSNLVLRGNIDSYSEGKGDVDIPIGDLIVTCGIVSTDTYNYNSIEDGFDPEKNRILHLKSGRYKNGYLKGVKEKLGQ